MSKFDEVKETLTNKIDELKHELKNDSTEQQDKDNNVDKDTHTLNEDNSETVGTEYLEHSIVEEEPEDRFDTDYDLSNENVRAENLGVDDSHDSGLDDFREDEPDDEIVNDSSGSLVVEEYKSHYGNDSDVGTVEEVSREEILENDTDDDSSFDRVV